MSRDFLSYIWHRTFVTLITKMCLSTESEGSPYPSMYYMDGYGLPSDSEDHKRAIANDRLFR